MGKPKCVSFSVKSIGNFTRLLTTICYERTHNPRDVAIFHERFDNDECDQEFEEFLTKLFPDGCTINESVIEALVIYLDNFMDKDDKVRAIRNKYLKLDNPYWVYFDIEDKVIPCDFGNHAKVVIDICRKYFNNVFVTDEDLYKFIKRHFEIHSQNSDLEHMALGIKACMI